MGYCWYHTGFWCYARDQISVTFPLRLRCRVGRDMNQPAALTANQLDHLVLGNPIHAHVRCIGMQEIPKEAVIKCSGRAPNLRPGVARFAGDLEQKRAARPEYPHKLGDVAPAVAWRHVL